LTSLPKVLPSQLRLLELNRVSKREIGGSDYFLGSESAEFEGFTLQTLLEWLGIGEFFLETGEVLLM
jgi:hypothetical protein